MSEEIDAPQWSVTIKEIVEKPDGTFDVTMDVPDNFKEWFMEWQGLKRWSEKRFQKIMSGVIKEHIESVNKTKSKVNQVLGLDEAKEQENQEEQT